MIKTISATQNLETAAEDHTGASTVGQEQGSGAAVYMSSIEDEENIAWSDKSQFLLQRAHGRVRNWCKQHESVALSCFVSTVQAAGGVMLREIFTWHS